MQALVKSRAGRGLWLEDVPVPKIGINDVLIRVRQTGICGTDVHIYEWVLYAPSVHTKAAGAGSRLNAAMFPISASRAKGSVIHGLTRCRVPP